MQTQEIQQIMQEKGIDNQSYDLLVTLGNRRGRLSRADITHAMPEIEYEEDLIHTFTQTFQNAGIEIADEQEILGVPHDIDEDGDSLVDIQQIENEALDINLEGVEVDDIIRLYLREAAQVPLLTANEEIELARRIERCTLAYEEISHGVMDENRLRELHRIMEEGRQARERLIRANARLVVSVARRYTNRGLPLSDLIQEGNIGLMRAVRNFDYRRGFKFSTYATWWIRQAVSRALADQGRTIRLPAYISDQISRLRRVQLQLQQSLNRSPSSEELAEAMGLSTGQIDAMLGSLSQPQSLEMTVGDDSDTELGELLEDENAPDPEDAVSDLMDRNEVVLMLEKLPEREQQILRMRFGLGDEDPMTLSEIGQRMGITRERARQLEIQALQRLRDPEAASQRKRRGPMAKNR